MEDTSELANGVETKDHVSHPIRNEFPIIEPTLELDVSSDPLQAIDVFMDNIFVCDSSGHTNRWVVQD